MSGTVNSFADQNTVEQHDVSVVVPLFNSENWIFDTLSKIVDEVSAASKQVEIIVIDDGSTDDSVERIAALVESGSIKVFRTENQGRFKARSLGVELADARFILFVDSRVEIEPGSIKYLLTELSESGSEQLWNATVRLPNGLPLVSYFWEGIEHIAWRKHFRGPRRISVPVEELDFHPVGTTMFGAPRDWLLEEIRILESTWVNFKEISDDTRLIRELALRAPLQYSTEFSCTYNPRTSRKAFINHAFHRGKVFVDGHLRKHGRYVMPYIVLMLSQIIFLVFAILQPAMTLSIVALLLGIALVASRALAVPRRASLSMLLYGPIFFPAYTFGSLVALTKKLGKSKRKTTKQNEL